MIVALTGMTGYIGRFVVRELAQQGVIIRALARPESDRDGFPESIEWIAGDLTDEDALATLVAGADAVVHMAYAHVPGKYRGGEGDDLPAWLNANLTGSLRLLTAAKAAGVGRFVFLSSRAVFSHTEPGRDLDEQHPTSPDTHYGAYKAAVEAFLQSFARVSDMKTFSVRATGVYGVTWPVERSKWWPLVQTVLAGEPITSTRGGTEVYGGDVARVIWALLNRPELESGPVHLSDLVVTHRDIVRLVRQYATLPGPLPDPPAAPPENMMVSRRLAELGITLSGWPAVEATIAALVQAAMTIDQ
jgi:UDP-glucose 4-epimerase